MIQYTYYLLLVCLSTWRPTTYTNQVQTITQLDQLSDQYIEITNQTAHWKALHYAAVW